MARAKKSAAVLKAEGKSHYSKEFLAERERSEPKVNLPNVAPPKYLTTKKQHSEFDDLASKLKTVGDSFFTELDVDTLARYVLAREQYVTCDKKVRALSRKGLFDTREFEIALRAQDRAFTQCRACGNDLGLTISARCKVEIPKVEEKETANRFGKFEK